MKSVEHIFEYNDEMTQLHSNIVPKQVVSLEKFFNLQDKFHKLANTRTTNSSMDYEMINLKKYQNMKMINLGPLVVPMKKDVII